MLSSILTGTQPIEAGEVLTVAEVLANRPPSNVYKVAGLKPNSQGAPRAQFPAIRLFCASEECGKVSFFDTDSPSLNLTTTHWAHAFVFYVCRHCQNNRKSFAVAVRSIHPVHGTGEVIKYGENPSFGPPLPARLKKVINKGGDWDLFSKGRRCESQGLGIAAFAYYRRVVENRKNDLFEEIRKVAESLGAPKEFTDSLEAAKKDTRFTASVERLTAGIPQVLLINGHNPLTLLHSALSKGLHDEPDDVCLSLASSIREILGEMCERMAEAIKEEAGLNKAVSTLLQYQQKKATPKGSEQ